MPAVTTPQDSELLDLVQRHQAGLWRYLRFLGCDPAQADDLAQETFLRIFRKPVAFYSPEAASAYLRSIARTLFLKSFRSRPFLEAMSLEAAVIGLLPGRRWNRGRAARVPSIPG